MEKSWDEIYDEFCEVYGTRYGMYSGTFAEYIIENYTVVENEFNNNKVDPPRQLPRGD